MTAAHDAAAHGRAGVVRPPEHVEAVRRDAARAAEEIAAEDGAEQDDLIPDAISWALGDRDRSPFMDEPTPGGAGSADVDAEIAACHAYLESTSWSGDADATISRAQDVLKILEWLTGADDTPPTYRRETEPGDLVGGRGRIVRSTAEIRRMLALAAAKLAVGQTSYSLGADWHQGVIATLGWVVGDRAASPILGRTRSGLPDGPDIAIEQDEAAERATTPQVRAEIPAQFADAAAVTCRWLLGGTTRPPVTDDD